MTFGELRDVLQANEVRLRTDESTFIKYNLNENAQDRTYNKWRVCYIGALHLGQTLEIAIAPED